jgi:hypothetical protein
MPRRSAAELEMIETVLDQPRLEPPAEFTPEQRADWAAIVGTYAPSHFGGDSRPLLIELVTHLALSRHIAQQLDEMRHARLNLATRRGAQVRSTYAELVRMAQHESRLIMSLSTKLRLTHSSRRNDRVDERRLETLPGMRKPWEHQ